MGHQFAMRLKELRMERGLLQRDLERALSLSPGACSQYERGLREPGFDLLLAIADYFDATVDYLLGRPDTPRERPAMIQGRAELRRRLSTLSGEFGPLGPGGRLARLLTLAEEVAPDLFSRARLAHRLPIDERTLRGVPQGKGPVPSAALRRMAHYLGLTPEWFFGVLTEEGYTGEKAKSLVNLHP